MIEYDTRIHTWHASGTGDNFRIINLVAMGYERHRNNEEDFNFQSLFSLQGKSFQWRKDKGVWKKYSGNLLTDSAFNWSRSVHLWLAMNEQNTTLLHVMWQICDKDVLERFTFPMKGGSLFFSLFCRLLTPNLHRWCHYQAITGHFSVLFVISPSGGFCQVSELTV